VFGDVTWLFFDLGGTLVDETWSYRAWFANAAALTGGALSGADIEREYRAGVARGQPTVTGQLRPYGFTGPDTQHLYPSELDRPYPQAAAVVAHLAQRYRLGIIANQNPGAADRLQAWGLRQHFEVVVASAEAGLSKPDPRIFELALSLAGCQPAQAVMIGDRIDNDIRPAKQAGWHTVRLRQGYAAAQPVRTPADQPDATVPSLAALLPLFP
jgi:HAD superfamily hydrolase (TIGR01509 family)